MYIINLKSPEVSNLFLYTNNRWTLCVYSNSKGLFSFEITNLKDRYLWLTKQSSLYIVFNKYFLFRLQFEQDILSRRFVEHGEYEKAYYGTSLEAIRAVVNQEKICVLNLHPQSLRILKNSDLMPYVVFVAPPSLVQLKR